MDTTSLPPDDRPPVAGPRRVNRGLLWASALAVVVLAVATIVAFTAGDGGSTAGDVQAIDPNGTPPVDDSLTGRDVTGEALPAVSYKTFDGAEVPLSTDGKPLLINFWSSTCAPVHQGDARPRADLPGQRRQRRVPGPPGLRAGRVRPPDDRAAPASPTRPAVTAPAEVFRAFGGVGLPRTVLVRADGTIAYVHSGALTAAELQQAIDENLGS